MVSRHVAHLASVTVGHVFLVLLCVSDTSPLHNELGHLPAGLSHWQTGSLQLYRVNPPLVRMLAAFPVLWANPKTDWTEVDDSPRARPEFSNGVQFAYLNGERTQWLCTLARWGCIPLSLLGAWACYRWSHELYGPRAALVSLYLWCFCPLVLAWGATIVPDVGSAAFGVFACYRFWKWLKQPTLWQGIAAGALLGAAELTKSTWLVLFVIWPVCWAWHRISVRRSTAPDALSSRPSVLGLAGILLLGVYILNLGYGFDGVGHPLGQFEFISETLGGEEAHDIPGNRFRGSILEDIPIPLPYDYVRGLDVQKYDFESGMWSYLRGEFRREGWWYYYIYGLTIKTPVGFLGLLLVAIGLTIDQKRYRVPVQEGVVLWLPPLAVLVLLSSQAGFNFHIRYALPVIPFFCIAISRVGLAFDSSRQWLRAGIILLLAAGVVESLSVVPHSLSFFNVAVGGPTQGHWHLLDSNVDWGQDLHRLKQWQDDHPEAKPLYADVYGILPPKSFGIESLPVPHDPKNLPPGWYAISLNRLHGYSHHHIEPGYPKFLHQEPVDRAGYSIGIYRIP